MSDSWLIPQIGAGCVYSFHIGQRKRPEEKEYKTDKGIRKGIKEQQPKCFPGADSNRHQWKPWLNVLPPLPWLAAGTASYRASPARAHRLLQVLLRRILMRHTHLRAEDLVKRLG